VLVGVEVAVGPCIGPVVALTGGGASPHGASNGHPVGSGGLTPAVAVEVGVLDGTGVLVDVAVGAFVGVLDGVGVEVPVGGTGVLVAVAVGTAVGGTKLHTAQLRQRMFFPGRGNNTLLF